MRGLSKKMLISILTSVIVFVTMVATTFAWVGIFTYASTDKFEMNLKVSRNANDYLTISATGVKGSFSDEANITEIQKNILKNLDKWTTKDDELYAALDDIGKARYVDNKYGYEMKTGFRIILYTIVANIVSLIGGFIIITLFNNINFYI